MALNAATKTFMLMGQCVPCLKHNASKIRIKRLELDQNLLMYFQKFEYVYAFDPDKKCKTGDIVLVEQLPEKLTRLITHKVKKIVYPLGDITDPLTGKKCVVSQYREDIENLSKIYGESRNAFKYDQAPKRGWQEGKRDFSDKDTYFKYHELDEKDPYAI